MKKNIWYILLILVLVIQLLRIDKTVPTVDPFGTFESIYTSTDIDLSKIKASCYDCHSYTSKYPWYAEVAPVSWWLKGHINGGREHVNFSIWNSYSIDKQNRLLEECAEWTEEHKMPLKSYVWMHPEAELSAAQRAAMVETFRALRR